MTLFKLMTEEGKVAHKVEAASLEDAARLFDIHMRLRAQSQPALTIIPLESCFGMPCFDDPPPGPPPKRWVTTLGVFHIKQHGQSRKTESRMGKP